MARRAAKQADHGVVEYAGTPREMIPHDHPEYAYRTLEELKRYWAMTELNAISFSHAWTDAMEAQIWKRWPPDSPYKNKTQMCLSVFGTTVQGVEQRVKKAQERAAETKDLDGHGGDRRSVVFQDHNIMLKPGRQGTDADYLVARLKRDHENVWSDLRDGKYRSVRAAARAAGLPIKEYAQVPRTVDGFATAARKYLTTEQRHQLAEALLHQD